MNKLNPFDPQNSATEKLNQSRARLRLAVFAAFGVAVLVLIPVLVQGCKREEPPVDTGLNPLPAGDATNLPEADTQHSNVYVPPMLPALPPSTNMPPEISTSALPQLPPASTTMLPPALPANPTPAVGGKYTIAKGDMLYTIAKKQGVSTKALLEANPGIDPKHLKVGQEINLPAGGNSGAVSSTVSGTVTDTAGSNVYVVKSGDTLIRVAKRHNVTVKALKAANNLQTDRIKVGEKLKIPAAASTAPAPVTPPPVTEPAPAVNLPTLPPAATSNP